jgi:hypothetical protein
LEALDALLLTEAAFLTPEGVKCAAVFIELDLRDEVGVEVRPPSAAIDMGAAMGGRLG